MTGQKHLTFLTLVILLLYNRKIEETMKKEFIGIKLPRKAIEETDRILKHIKKTDAMKEGYTRSTLWRNWILEGIKNNQK